MKYTGLPVHVGIRCDHVESAKHSIELTPDIWKPQAHLNTARLPYVSLYSTIISLESSTLIGGHLTMTQSGGELDQSPANKRKTVDVNGFFFFFIFNNDWKIGRHVVVVKNKNALCKSEEKKTTCTQSFAPFLLHIDISFQIFTITIVRFRHGSVLIIVLSFYNSLLFSFHHRPEDTSHQIFMSCMRVRK